MLAWTMQLVQQGLEFLFADLVVAGRRGRRSGGSARRFVARHATVLALTVQLVEQGLEFFLGNFVVIRRRGRPGGLDQLLKGLVRHIGRRAFLHRCGRLRCGGITLEQVFQILQHAGFGVRRLLPATQGVELGIQYIQYRQHDIHQP